ncbi:MAG: GntR family transcriptional regulator [SAR324 cluster bacterium]|nr:GntR family transcriptional regulator [SAR324 cluster bacterium]
MFQQLPNTQPRLADEVYRQVFSAILSGHIEPGERIVQEKIAAEINVSRTPVREALLRLEQEGILEIASRSGFRIRKITDAEVRQIYQAREAVEGYSARIMAESGTPTQHNAIETVIAQEQQSQPDGIEDFFRANKRIHRTIVEQTDNRHLLEMFDSLWNRGISFRLFAAISNVDLAESLGEHQVLVDTIRVGSPEAAEAAMVAHIRDGLDLQLEALI